MSISSVKITLMCGKRFVLPPPANREMWADIKSVVVPHLDECQICREALQQRREVKHVPDES